ncbi:MAG: hypothetical protein KIH09_16545 [Candidatus Freyarchaeota archaeon]|nr:hypothetical protein [Candidatus Jordarchaeia archaeon]
MLTRRKIIRMSFLIISIAIAFSVFINVSLAQSRRIYLEPSTYEFPETTPLGTLFNVTIWVEVEEGLDIGGAQIYLEFNDSIINVTRWICPHGDPDFFLPEPPTATELPTSPDPGYVHLAPGRGYVKIAVCKGGLPPTAPWGHSGKIAIFEFNITATPPPVLSSVLKINTIDTYLLDPNNAEISDVVKEDGSVTIWPEFQSFIAAVALVSLTFITVLLKKRYHSNP